MNDKDTEVLNYMLDYIQHTIEAPQLVFGGMPICPFARKARLTDKFLYKVYEFSKSDLQPHSELMTLIQEFGQQEHYELLLVIHPEPKAFNLEEMHEFTNCVNQLIVSFGLLAFDGHPQDDFNIHGVYTRKAPYIHFTVQLQDQVKQASDVLQRTSYYQNWTHQHFKYVGMSDR